VLIIAVVAADFSAAALMPNLIMRFCAFLNGRAHEEGNELFTEDLER
jgi:hypothetical protein